MTDMSEGKELVTKPEVQIVNVADAREAMMAFEDFKRAVLTDSDFYEQSGKKYVRKSGWMKYAMALGISTEVFDEVCQTVKFNGADTLIYNFTAKASAPNGRFAIAVGSASSDEGKPWAKALHSIRAMAQTRAVERAISNLVGGGEVGAEELETKSVDAEYRIKERQADSEVSGEQDILDAITEAGLDPQGVEVTTRDWGKFVIKPAWPKPKTEDENPWRRYNDVLKKFGAMYHGSAEKDVELKYNWTIGV